MTTSTWRRTPNDPAEWFSADELDRSRRYQRPLRKLRALRAGLSALLILVFVFGEVARRLFDGLDVSGWALQLIVVLLALQLASLVIDVPLDAWVDLKHDREWELSTQTGKGLAVDHVKDFLLGMVMNVALMIPLYAILRSTDWWWLWGWLVVTGFSLLLGFLFPIVIAPIFNKFTKLEPGPVAERIDAVADRAGVQITGTYVADESKRSRRDNAYVAGLGASRRVVLYDTLLEHPVEVVEQVVAHEIGHWRLRHLARQLPFVTLVMLGVFVGLRAIASWDWLLEHAGVDVSEGIGDPASLPLVLLSIQVLFGLAGLALNFMSRAFERQADVQALELLGQPDALIDMHRRLHVKNLADLDPGPLTRLRASHPPAAERMALARSWAAANS